MEYDTSKFKKVGNFYVPTCLIFAGPVTYIALAYATEEVTYLAERTTMNKLNNTELYRHNMESMKYINPKAQICSAQGTLGHY